jgi:hypothetical protein
MTNVQNLFEPIATKNHFETSNFMYRKKQGQSCKWKMVCSCICLINPFYWTSHEKNRVVSELADPTRLMSQCITLWQLNADQTVTLIT